MGFDRANITKEGTDDKDVRIQQYSKNGDVDDAEIYAPYGMSYNLPENSLCLFALVGGDDGNIILLPDRSQDRVKDLKRGEVAFFNPLTQSRIIYKENTDISATAEGPSANFETNANESRNNVNFLTVIGSVSVGTGASGSFSSGEGKVITVQDGIITGIV